MSIFITCFFAIIFSNYAGSSFGAPTSKPIPELVTNIYEPMTTLLSNDSLDEKLFTTISPSDDKQVDLIPGIADTMLFRPIHNMTHQITESAKLLPAQLGHNGEVLGSILIQPILAWNSTANIVLERVNQTIVSASNAIHPVLIQPLLWMESLSTTISGVATNAINRTSAQMGKQFAIIGESIQDTGKDVQHIGATLAGFSNNLTVLNQQLYGNLTNIVQ